MKQIIVLVAILAAAFGQYKPADIVYPPIPYSFNYLFDTEDGGNSNRQESGDGSGKVQGSYTVTNLEGHTRYVEYEAGPEGFKAFIRTNEPGTYSSNPAGVVMESTASETPGPARRYSNDAPAAPRSSGANTARGGQQGNTRYVLVPSTDPRASGRTD